MSNAEWQATYDIGKATKATGFTIRWPRRRTIVIFASLIIAISLAAFTVWELRTSRLQARYLARVACELTFWMGPGSSTSIRFPGAGPHDRRLGYAYLRDFSDRLGANGYNMEAQARFSPRLLALTGWGISPIYHEKSQAGLRILDRDDRVVFAKCHPERIYETFDSIPGLVVRTLIFIENRELLDSRYPHRNPAVEWDRFAKASFDMALHVVQKNRKVVGGSTLATQLEKFKHSPGGRTSSPREKLRQMTSAALRVYLDGEESLKAQRRIILDYINSIPLAAIPGYGEVQGLGDGLWEWYRADFDSVNSCLHDNARGDNDPDPAARALAYKQVLSLFLAHRRPSFYLVENQSALRSRTDDYILFLASAGVISDQMRDAALKAELRLHQSVSIQPGTSFSERKAANALRAHLSALLGVPDLYDLDRLDLTVKTTLDYHTQNEVVKVLQQLGDLEYARAAGLVGDRLLGGGDLSRVVYSFTLYERLGNANLLRVQADSLDQPLNINEGVKLELGSSAKLRTLITYLEIVAELHERYAGLSQGQLRSIHVSDSDRLSQWAISYLLTASDKSLMTMLEAAMQRRYSASPAEIFFTGGGEHTFVNFDRKYDSQVMSVRDGFLNSVNLVFIRLMRDIVRYCMFQLPSSTASILGNEEDPERQVYLSRFADREGRIFLSRFYRKYKGKSPEEAMDILLQGVRPIPSRLATVFRSIAPEVDIQQFAVFMRSQLPGSTLDDADMSELYEKYSKSAFNLNDRGYIARIHPLELWIVEYLRDHPGASLTEVMEAGTDQRQEVYVWLFKTRWKHAQDIRIRTLLEIEAFQEIHAAWKRLGYPFDSLVPSYATAIGSSADRPASLAELVGIILNDGVRYPTLRIQQLHFAEKTPYETILRYEESAGERVLPSEIVTVVRSALSGVVEEGTAQRMRGAFLRSDKSSIAVGGKTGTGDNRRDTYGRRGILIKSEVINRTATFVFFIGDRFFGTITVYVDGPAAARHEFTSSLPLQIMKILTPKLMPMIDRANGSDKQFAVEHGFGGLWICREG